MQSQSGMMVHGCLQAVELVHAMQCSIPDALANVPGAQQLHPDWPVKGLKVPGAQGVHSAVPTMEKEPAGHTESVSVVLTVDPVDVCETAQRIKRSQQNVSTNASRRQPTHFTHHSPQSITKPILRTCTAPEQRQFWIQQRRGCK